MALDKATATKIFIALMLVPIAIFTLIFLSGFSRWTTAAMRFQECNDGMQAILKATAAMLNIVFGLLVLFAVF